MRCLKCSLLLLSYNHDQAHPIYFSLPASFRNTEFAGYLPSDEALWAATSPEAWQRLLNTPSPYGMGEERLRGVSVASAFKAIGIENDKLSSEAVGLDAPPKDLGIVSPFGHFILIHAILAMLCDSCKNSTPCVPASSSSSSSSSSLGQNGASVPGTVPVGEEVNENVFVIQLALHRWLRIWLQNPEANRTPNICIPGATTSTTPPGGSATEGKKSRDTLFFADPLPFYWLAQLLLLAFQEQLPPFAPKAKSGPPRYRWDRITAFQPAPPSVHDDPPYASPTSSHLSSLLSGGGGGGGTSSSSSTTDSRPHASPEFVSPAYYRAPNLAPQMLGAQSETASTQFTLVKRWLHHIRLFLKRSEGSPTVVWDELMKIRLTGWGADVGSNGGSGGGAGDDGEESVDGGSVNGRWEYEEHGLLGFFEEVDQKLKI